MNDRHTAWTVTGFVLFGVGLAPAWAGPGDEPVLRGPISMQDSSRAFLPMVEGPPHEAIRPSGRGEDPLWVGKAPPPPIVVRPTEEPPSRDAQWIEGYWDWDQGRGDFDWVPGTWSVAPPGKVWSAGEWRQDTQGWYRVAGSWVNWRTLGPPPVQPEERIGPAPGPGYFSITGRYAPEGDALVWKPGFWARVQPGWNWAPAIWVRQADGWTYREGFWAKDRGIQTASTSVAGPARVDAMIYRTSARPVPDAASFPDVGAMVADRDPGRDATAPTDLQPFPEVNLGRGASPTLPSASLPGPAHGGSQPFNSSDPVQNSGPAISALGPRDLSPEASDANGDDLRGPSGGDAPAGWPGLDHAAGSAPSAGVAAYGRTTTVGIGGASPDVRRPVPPGVLYYRYPPRPPLFGPRYLSRGVLGRFRR